MVESPDGSSHDKPPPKDVHIGRVLEVVKANPKSKLCSLQIFGTLLSGMRPIIIVLKLTIWQMSLHKQLDTRSTYVRLDIVNRMTYVGHNLDTMRQSACLVVNPITVYSYGFLYDCTTVMRPKWPKLAGLAQKICTL